MKFILVYYFIYILYFFTQKIGLTHVQFHFLDVGQGDAVFVQAPDAFGLIDGGPDYSLDYSLDNKIPFLWCKLNYIVASHPHKDHIQGLTRVLQRCSVSQVLLNDVPYESKTWANFKSVASLRSKLVNYPLLPHRLSSYYKATFFAHSSSTCTNDVNICSLVMQFVLNQSSVLLTGDMYARYLADFPLAPVTILKAPHHGGKATLSMPLLARLRPKIAVLSYGVPNKYGHPSQETMSLLRALNVRVLTTEEGDVLVKALR
jgi:competence protein ComEC